MVWKAITNTWYIIEIGGKLYIVYQWMCFGYKVLQYVPYIPYIKPF